jgi:hypothetical protein
MMAEKMKLELTWYGKEVVHEIEPRILIQNPELSRSVEAKTNTLFAVEKVGLSGNESIGPCDIICIQDHSSKTT